MVPDPPEDLNIERLDRAPAPPALLLRFDAFLHNAGPGLLEIRGSDPDAESDPRMLTVVQRFYSGVTRTSTFRDEPITPLPRLQYQSIYGHNHFHLWDPVDYFLVGTGESSASLLYDKASIGFCFVDTEPIEATFPPLPEFLQAVNHFCDQGNPGAATVFMGLSPGWRDVYDDQLPLQYIDISNVRPGPYRVTTVTDPQHYITEVDEINNRSQADADPRVTVPGYVALGIVARSTLGRPVTVQLQSRPYTSELPGADLPGSPEYLVTQAPAHGQLVHIGAESGQAWNDGSYLYVPDLGYRGNDTLTFEVRDSVHRDFPYDKPSAEVTLTTS